MEISKLHEIGLTQGEIKIYEALLELGETTRNNLVKKSGVSPSKIYDVVDRLIEKGIVSSVRKQGILHFSPANPERIRDFVEGKEKKIALEKEAVNSIMPLLLQRYNSKKDITDIEVFYGWEGMKTVYRDMVHTLSKSDTNFVLGASRGEDTRMADIFFSRHAKDVRKKGFKIKIIFNEDLRNYKERIASYIKSPNEARFLHQNTFTEINMYKDIVLLVMLLKRPIIIRIKNKGAADSFKKFFDSMWILAKK